MEVTHGHLLGGRLRYAQPRDGYRTGIEPVLLAASVPAQPGQRVLEAGTGAGAGLLCLAARVPGVRGVGIEIDPAMADLARRNLRDNDINEIDIITGDIGSVAPGKFDHAFGNPPWHDPRSTSSPVERRRRAKQASGDDLERWVVAMRRMLAPGGSLTLILPASQLVRARLAVGGARVRELRAKRDRAAKLVIVQAGRGEVSRAAATVLHEADGSFTPEVDAILRHGAGFRFGDAGATAA